MQYGYKTVALGVLPFYLQCVVYNVCLMIVFISEAFSLFWHGLHFLLSLNKRKYNKKEKGL